MLLQSALLRGQLLLLRMHAQGMLSGDSGAVMTTEAAVAWNPATAWSSAASDDASAMHVPAATQQQAGLQPAQHASPCSSADRLSSSQKQPQQQQQYKPSEICAPTDGNPAAIPSMLSPEMTQQQWPQHHYQEQHQLMLQHHQEELQQRYDAHQLLAVSTAPAPPTARWHQHAPSGPAGSSSNACSTRHMAPPHQPAAPPLPPPAWLQQVPAEQQQPGNWSAAALMDGGGGGGGGGAQATSLCTPHSAAAAGLPALVAPASSPQAAVPAALVPALLSPHMPLLTPTWQYAPPTVPPPPTWQYAPPAVPPPSSLLHLSPCGHLPPAATATTPTTAHMAAAVDVAAAAASQQAWFAAAWMMQHTANAAAAAAGALQQQQQQQQQQQCYKAAGPLSTSVPSSDKAAAASADPGTLSAASVSPCNVPAPPITRVNSAVLLFHLSVRSACALRNVPCASAQCVAAVAARALAAGSAAALQALWAAHIVLVLGLYTLLAVQRGAAAVAAAAIETAWLGAVCAVRQMALFVRAAMLVAGSDLAQLPARLLLVVPTCSIAPGAIFIIRSVGHADINNCSNSSSSGNSSSSRAVPKSENLMCPVTTLGMQSGSCCWSDVLANSSRTTVQQYNSTAAAAIGNTPNRAITGNTTKSDTALTSFCSPIKSAVGTPLLDACSVITGAWTGLGLRLMLVWAALPLHCSRIAACAALHAAGIASRSALAALVLQLKLVWALMRFSTVLSATVVLPCGAVSVSAGTCLLSLAGAAWAVAAPPAAAMSRAATTVVPGGTVLLAAAEAALAELVRCDNQQVPPVLPAAYHTAWRLVQLTCCAVAAAAGVMLRRGCSHITGLTDAALARASPLTRGTLRACMSSWIALLGCAATQTQLLVHQLLDAWRQQQEADADAAALAGSKSCCSSGVGGW